MSNVSFNGVRSANLGQCETCIVLWWVHLYCFPHIRESYGVEKPQRSVPPRLLHAQSEAWGWISDGLGCQIMAFPWPNTWARWARHCQGLVKDWFDEHESEVEHLPWPAQSPDLNIIEPPWGVLEEWVRKRFPPPASRSYLATILQEEWLKIPLTTVQDLYMSFPRRIDAVLAAKGGPTPF